MPSPAPPPRLANTPDDLHTIIQHAINGADVEAFLDAHHDDTTVVIPPDGQVVCGREEIRIAITPLLALQPQMETVVVQKLEGPTLALTHGRWHFTIIEDGCRAELSGVGTMVSRRGDDGSVADRARRSVGGGVNRRSLETDRHSSGTAARRPLSPASPAGSRIRPARDSREHPTRTAPPLDLDARI